jgi:nitrogenase-stabilizing/protective protein
MNILNQLGKLSSAEEFFSALDVPFDQAILNVARLHILRRMGQYLSEIPSECSNDELYEHARGTLLKAYLDFVHSTPIEQKVFKVHRQAAAGVSAPLITIEVARDLN